MGCKRIETCLWCVTSSYSRDISFMPVANYKLVIKHSINFVHVYIFNSNKSLFICNIHQIFD
jgi:hypothetical protein